LLRDILRGDDPSVTATVDVLVDVAPDIVVLQGFDYDLNKTALDAFAEMLAASGLNYPHRFALPGNAGRQTPLDLDGDGRLGGPGDAQGYGEFFGRGAMAILSRFPILTEDVQDYTDLLWRDLPGALLPQTDAGPFPSAEAQAIQRLSSHGHWVVPLDAGALGRVTLLTFHASPPVFDGPEDRNGRRNHDEIAFWQSYLAGAFGPVPEDRFVLLGDANLDPVQGEGIKSAINSLLKHPALKDPLPDQPTVTWEGVGDLRVDYLLPSTDWTIAGAGIRGTEPGIASRHGLVWVDLER
jgi:hypothetical protein